MNGSKTTVKTMLCILIALAMVFSIAACGAGNNASPSGNNSGNTVPSNTDVPGGDDDPEKGKDIPIEKNGEVYILYTSDVHCGIEEGFGYAGLVQIRDSLKAQGYEVLLVDDGDALQGEAIGTLTKGEAILELMNDVGYDVAVPGNHDFDFSVERFLELAGKAKFTYISCNFNYKGELIFKPYVIKEAAGMKIAFVGICTPETLTASTPAYFRDESGEVVYGFMQDESGQALYDAVQKAVDAARAEGADLVYAMAHLGNAGASSPWAYEDVIRNTTGIDVFFDGHSHDMDQATVTNKNGDPVVRSACGTKLQCIGYSRIGTDKKPAETGIWSWNNSISPMELFGADNYMTAKVEAAKAKVEEQLTKVVAETAVELTINDPVEKLDTGAPVRMVRRAETNLGDLVADAYRDAAKADIGLSGGGGIRTSIPKGDITYGQIINVQPFGNQVAIIRATGQQVLDALEWGARAIPGEFGGFLQVSGLTYEIDVNVPTPCKSVDGVMTGIEGERRVRNVMVDGKPIDPAVLYTVASTDYWLLGHGDGYTAFDGAEVIQEFTKLDNQALIDYIVDTLGGNTSDYEDPYGHGRITIIDVNN